MDEASELPVDEASELPVDAAEVEADTTEDLASLVAVEVASAVEVEEVVSVMPQTASASNVKGKFLVSHPKLCRWMESEDAKIFH